MIISTHILTKRMTGFGLAQWTPATFQLTSSRRGWLITDYALRLLIAISTHILTKRMTEILQQLPETAKDFNSHPHEEDDNHSSFLSKDNWHFNSHPHEEDDMAGMEQEDCQENFNSHPHEEDDGRKRCYVLQVYHFNSHPHEEDDLIPWQEAADRIISTHILTKRMTAILNKNNLFKIAYYISNKHFISIVDIFFHFHIYF